MIDEIKNRCINIDWLEVYCLESTERYPCNADYFRRQGYLVQEREYGTRVYKEMFTIVNESNEPLIEIRRNPASGQSSFNGLIETSTHIRLPNWMLYQGNPIEYLRSFLLKNDYIFKRIYRIDIAYDFEYFDSGDKPSAFARRYLEGKFRKINQCDLAVHGKDKWDTITYNSLSWGSRTSMVNTKLYNKTMELRQAKSDKPWIKTCWVLHGLIDNPMSMTKRNALGELYNPEIWRVEFSMMSQADGWIALEFNQGTKPIKQVIPHKLSMFDTPDKLWQRFQDLAYNYFHFKHADKKKRNVSVTSYALEKVHSDLNDEWQRKDRCRDKVLFYWDKGHKFLRLSMAPAQSKPSRLDDVLRRKLLEYKITHSDMKIRDACDILLHNIERISALRFVPLGDNLDRRAWQRTLAEKINGDEREAMRIFEEVRALLEKDEIW